MKKRKLRNLEVSAVGLGCMGFSHAYGAPTEKEEAIYTLQSAVDMGYTFFDTAEVYGTEQDPHANERLVGEAFQGKRDKVIIATKFGIHFDTQSGVYPYPLLTDASPKTIRTSVESSLKRLKTDYIDLYFQHRMDINTEPEEVAGVMKDLIQEGKVRAWGISEATEDYLRRANAVCPVTAVENRYSMMARHYEALFPVLEELGIGFVAFSPMANGLLTGQYTANTQFDTKYDYRSRMPQFQPDSYAQNQELFSLLHDIATVHETTPAAISMAWMLCKKPWIVPIPGTRKIERLKENMGAASISLTVDEVKNIDDALRTIPMSEVFGGSKIVTEKR